MKGVNGKKRVESGESERRMREEMVMMSENKK